MYDETKIIINGLTEPDLYYVIKIPLTALKITNYCINFYNAITKRKLIIKQYQNKTDLFIIISYVDYYRKIPHSIRLDKYSCCYHYKKTWEIINLIYSKERNFNYEWWKD